MSGGLSVGVKRSKTDEDLEDSILQLQFLCEGVAKGIEHQERAAKKARMADEEKLRKEVEKMDEKETQREIMRARLRMFVGDKGNCLTLDVGGVKFVTTRDTLMAIPDTLFTALLSGHFSIDKTDDGAIKLDRDPAYFSYILNYLRGYRETGRCTTLFTLKGLPNLSAMHIAQEAEFYGLTSLRAMALNYTSFIVSKEVDSPYNTVNEALEKASNGDRIVVYPGTYFESITVTKEVEIVGEGPRDKIVIVTTDGNPTVVFKEGCKGKMCNISLREMSRFGVCTVEVKGQANVTLDQCDLSTRQEANTINVSDKASLTLTMSRIHGAKGSAVLIRDEASAEIKNNELINIKCCALQARHDATYELSGNVIQNAAYGGVDAADNTKGVIRNNSISHCKRAGVVLHGSSSTNIQGNVISKNECGVRLFPDSKILSFTDNRIYNNTNDLEGLEAPGETEG
eukprot:TRINITY_DN3557_c0_g1_i1.p1 TRINITY_DN3557_c0_g1~~TRINITY_DN3557_c0_g1_i1.p1  ORF type:complete len:456 (+),score=84.19 TRINITY_DN3557_c0_g1_i1:94-1461(+)